MEHYLFVCGLLLALVHYNHATEEGETLEFGEEFKGLKAEVLIPPAENCERYSKRGDLLSVHFKAYTAKDMDMFDSSYDTGRGDPEVFHIGTREKIPAWDLALLDMCVGEKRKLIIPAEYGFGEYGSRDGKVGPYENLIYEVEMVTIEDGPVQGPIEAFTNIDKDNDGYLTMEEIGKNLWHHVKKFPNEHDMYRKDMNLFRDKIWKQMDWNDIDLDGFQSFYEFFFFSSLGTPYPPDSDYYVN